MTDVKGVRALRPSEQPNPHAYVRVVEEGDNGTVRRAKANITGIAVVDEVIVLPTRAMTKSDEAALAFAVPLDTPGVTVVVGYQIDKARGLEGGDMDGVPYMAHHEDLIIFGDVSVPWTGYSYKGLAVDRSAGGDICVVSQTGLRRL